MCIEVEHHFIDTSMSERKDCRVMRVAGVPEHFNEPWQIAFEEKLFEKKGVDVQWISIREGTGAMIDKLQKEQVDLIVALTEGLINSIANGCDDICLVGTYVQSPLTWSVSTGRHSHFHSIEDLKGEQIGISRYQSGSHLMSCVLANQYGWKQSDLHFVVKHHFDNLRQSVNEQTTAAFLWEYFMQKPFYDKGEIRRIGEIVTPWPCFLIASRKSFVSQRFNDLKNLFVALEDACSLFRQNSTSSIQRICNNYHLTEEDAKCWFDRVIIEPTRSIAESTIETALDALRTARLLTNSNRQFSSMDFIETNFAKLIVDIKSMRLYNKPELLIALRNNLRAASICKGSISYIDLLPFDQNHYYGTEALDLAVRQLQLNNDNQIIQIGSNLGGCARYFAGKYHLKVLAVELQSDLSQAAAELTDRCHLSHLVHHITGDFLTVSEHLQRNFYHSIVSWITLLHFTQEEKIRLINQSFHLLQPNGFFFCEDFIRIANLTDEESKILQRDVYCHDLSTIDEYKTQFIQANFQLIQLVDLSEQWKTFTIDRLENFRRNKQHLLEIHGDEVYHRLEYFYSAIVKLFNGGHIGGIRIIAQKNIIQWTFFLSQTTKIFAF